MKTEFSNAACHLKEAAKEKQRVSKDELLCFENALPSVNY